MLQLNGIDFINMLSSLLWPFMRISGLFISAPIFAAKSIPIRIKIVLAMLISWLLIPLVPAVPGVDLISAEAVLISANQILIGIAMGFILQLVFSIFVVAGQSIAMGMGLGFASMVDPQNGVQVPLVSQVYLILITLVFLALNGHLLLINVLAESFKLLPVGVVGLSMDSLLQLAMWGSYMFTGGLLVALPIIAALLLINLSFGVAARAAPQLNIFAVGFPVMIMVGFTMMMLSVANLDAHLSRFMTDGFAFVQMLLSAGGN